MFGSMLVPQAVVSIFGGGWADRLNRKMLIIVADAAIAASRLGLALFMLSGVDSLLLFGVISRSGAARRTRC
ncbi:MAG: hypothetical protein WBL06_03210 [Pseudolysinimonas sp.]|jgi:DHA3 family macrolide efflux protein-like MFS transporter|uniref:hypothetical protein n=1 Tax=Pseudolysinimonas sp. TaxID=2680009 RepID=UPI003C783F84